MVFVIPINTTIQMTVFNTVLIPALSRILFPNNLLINLMSARSAMRHVKLVLLIHQRSALNARTELIDFIAKIITTLRQTKQTMQGSYSINQQSLVASLTVLSKAAS